MITHSDGRLMAIAASITRTADVKVGDRITEIDTPSGPFYAVLKVNPKSLVVEAASPAMLADGESVPVRISIRPGSSVLLEPADLVPVCACSEIGPLLTAPGTSGRLWRCGDCGTSWSPSVLLAD